MARLTVLQRLRSEDGSWEAFKRDWESQCKDVDGDFDMYENGPFGVVRDLVEGPISNDACAFALSENGSYSAMCQVNVAFLPGYTGKVLRVRMMYLSPDYDYGDKTIEDYIRVLTDLLYHILDLSDKDMAAPHVKFHLRSPADRQFFSALGNNLDKAGVFHSVIFRGSWLYITKN